MRAFRFMAVLSILSVLCTVLIAGTPEEAAFVESWPTSVTWSRIEGGGNAVSVKGLYGDSSTWSRWNDGDFNRLLRRLNKMAATDSLAINQATGVAYFYTEKGPGDAYSTFLDVARFSGFIPTWEELSARDQTSPHSDSVNYELVGQFLIENLGEFLYVPDTKENSTLALRFFDSNCRQFKPAAVQDILVQGRADGGVLFSVSNFDSMAYNAVIAFSSYQRPNFAEGRFAADEGGFVKLNPTWEYCKCHMNYALRIYNKSGYCVWLTESNLYGATGVWARDLDGDGVSEVIVFVKNHDGPRIMVFGKTG